ncbi:VanZ family protein [Bacillus sp. MRMR6]|uniref:VanZ family protein n=1 Tax=Bacillus sp. MRMR6 TaxID=1928617 RepID=UPI000950F693|nr:VanZ family protein [Bacillus sp. MRMR6]OLS33680.1 VanZ family protein [Bacillus sp. MRMR6]
MIRSFAYAQITFILSLPIWLKLTAYLHPIVIAVVWFCLTISFLFVNALVKNEKISIPMIVLHSLTALYSLGLLILLFYRPKNQSYGEINLVPFEMVLYYLSGHVSPLISIYNLAANIGLFIPFGLYYCLIREHPKLRQLIVIAICSISIIEGLQYLTKRGSLDIDDLILNVLGVCLGYLFYPLVKKVLTIN